MRAIKKIIQDAIECATDKRIDYYNQIDPKQTYIWIVRDMIARLEQVQEALVMDKGEDWQKIIGQWAEKVFGNHTDRIVKHFAREVEEFKISQSPEEAADCVMLLFHHAFVNGYDLLKEVAKKHQINLNRKWGKPDKDDVIEHVREIKLPCRKCGESGEELSRAILAQTVINLSKQIRQWETWGIIEIMTRNPNVDSFVKDKEQQLADKDIRILKLKLVLEKIKVHTDDPDTSKMAERALKGV